MNFPWHIIYLIGVALILLCLAGAFQVRSQELPQGLGHPPNHEQYFDSNCCNKNDCEMVPDSAIVEEKDGFRVRYHTNNFKGAIVEGFVKRGQEKMSKKCLDGFCQGVCSYLLKPGKATVRCLYVMPST